MSSIFAETIMTENDKIRISGFLLFDFCIWPSVILTRRGAVIALTIFGKLLSVSSKETVFVFEFFYCKPQAMV